MPYLMISTLIRMVVEYKCVICAHYADNEGCLPCPHHCLFHQESGPTNVGDQHSDPELMEYLGASRQKEIGHDFDIYQTPSSPREVLDKLELKGWSLVTVTGAGQTIIWTLHKAC